MREGDDDDAAEKVCSSFRKKRKRGEIIMISRNCAVRPIAFLLIALYNPGTFTRAYTHISVCIQNLRRSRGGARNWRAILSLSRIARSVFLTIPL